MRAMRRMFEEQQKEIAHLRKLAIFQNKKGKMDKAEVKRLLKELNENEKENKQ